ncbi:MAG: sugar O-acetyltransferase [Atopobiaceae bacterium]|jgi:maltose O-acetyltransferase
MEDEGGMTELQKLEAGLDYSFADPELQARKDLASMRCARLNETLPGTREHLQATRLLLGTDRDDVDLEPGFHCDCGLNIHVGKGFVANYNVTVLDVAPVEIGDHVMIGPGTLIATVGHPLSAKARRDKMCHAERVVIGDDVWVGGNATILPGVTIGDGAVVAAGAVVTRDVPAHSVVAGVPAKVVRRLEDDAG